MTNSLTFFQVDGAWRDVQEHIPSDVGDIDPQVDDVSAYIDFFPGTEKTVLAGGLTLYVPDYETYGDTELSIAPITGRTINGKLCTIAVGDPVGVKLVADSAWLGMQAQMDDDLFYHVRYRNVTYDSVLQRLPQFAFKAPTTNTAVRLTSPTLVRYDYRGP